MKIASHRIIAGALILSMSLVGTGFPLPNPAVGKAVEAGKSAPRKAVGKANTWLTGKLLVTGAATINGKKALSGSTVFSENRIAVALAVGNVAKITLGGLGRLDLQPGTELVLRFADGLIGGELLAGEAVIRNNAGVKVALRTAAGLVTADGRTATTTVANTKTKQAEASALSPQLEATVNPAGGSNSASNSLIGTTTWITIAGVAVVGTLIATSWIEDCEVEEYDYFDTSSGSCQRVILRRCKAPSAPYIPPPPTLRR